MPFIVLDRTYMPDRGARYVQFGDECATLAEAQKLAQFPNLRDPIIVNLDQVKRPPTNEADLNMTLRPGDTLPVRPARHVEVV